MRTITTKQSTIIGLLGLFGASIMAFVIYTLGNKKIEIAVIGSLITAYMLFLAYFGLFRSWLAFDQTYLVRRIGKSYERDLLDELTIVRTIPFFRSMGIVWFKFPSGCTYRTVVLDQDLTWIMSKVPKESITPYWRQKIG